MPRVEQCFADQDSSMDSNGNYTELQVPYLVFDLNPNGDPEDEALRAVLAHTPVKMHSRNRKSLEIDERLNETTMRVLVTYSDVDKDDDEEQEEEEQFSFDTGGGTKHIDQSLRTVSRTPVSAPDFEGAIGVDTDGNIAGVDITMPVMYFSETHYFKNSKVTTSYKKRLASLTGTVNQGSFRGYSTGEVLFLGASGSRRGDSRKDLWEISFKFAVSPNQKSLKVGNLTVPSKNGWDYLWVRFADSLSAQNSGLVKVPSAAYVEQVYPYENFSALGVGR